MDQLNIPLGSLVLTLLCGIHSRSALGITSSGGWNSSQNPNFTYFIASNCFSNPKLCVRDIPGLILVQNEQPRCESV
ncbi:hypothetical protein LguiB_024121 [Lonicera macranthoides]